MPMSPYLSRLRAKVGRDLLLLPAVAVIVRDPRGRLLLVRNRETGDWSLPAGGIDPGESPREAAIRELREECGIGCHDLELAAGLGGEGFRRAYPNGDRVEYAVFVYRGSASEDTVPDPQDTEEVGEARFFAREAAPPLPLRYPEHLLWEESAGRTPGQTRDSPRPSRAGAFAIRRADPERDVPSLVDLNRYVQDVHAAAKPTYFRPSDDMPGAEGFHRSFAGGAGRFTFVAEDDGRLIGYVSLEHQSRDAHTFAWEQNRLYVHQVSVHPEHRRRGVGAALMARVEELASRLGATEVALDTWSFNTAAREFFAALGYDVYNLRLRKAVDAGS